MSQYILKNRGHIDAAIVDIDNNAIAKQSRDEFAEKYGAKGHKTVMSAQNAGPGVELMAVTMLKFDRAAPHGFVTMGQDKDGSVLALPDFRTTKGEVIAKEMSELPRFSRQLPQAMGMSPKIEGGKVSYGVSSVEEIGRQIVVKTSRDVSPGLDVEPLSASDYAQMKQGVARAQKMASANAPTPFGR
jgi:hypothetical protein